MVNESNTFTNLPLTTCMAAVCHAASCVFKAAYVATTGEVSSTAFMVKILNWFCKDVDTKLQIAEILKNHSLSN